MNDPRRLICLILVACAALGISGCAINQPDGPNYIEAPRPSEDTALIYVYRAKGEEYGYARSYYLHANGKKVTDLLHGGYFPMRVKPGKHVLIADVNTRIQPILFSLIEDAIGQKSARVVIDAEGGETYYVKFTPVHETWSFRLKMEQITKVAAGYDLYQTKLLEPNPN